MSRDYTDETRDCNNFTDDRVRPQLKSRSACVNYTW